MPPVFGGVEVVERAVELRAGHPGPGVGHRQTPAPTGRHRRDRGSVADRDDAVVAAGQAVQSRCPPGSRGSGAARAGRPARAGSPGGRGPQRLAAGAVPRTTSSTTAFTSHGSRCMRRREPGIVAGQRVEVVEARLERPAPLLRTPPASAAGSSRATSSRCRSTLRMGTRPFLMS